MTDGGGRVREWLQSDDGTESVVEFGGAGASEFGEFDDSQYCLQPEEEEKVVVDSDDANVVAELLEEVARGAQRRAVCVLHRQYARGRMLDYPDYGHRELRRQMFFRVESFVQLSSLDDTTLVEQLMQGVVRTRVGGETGIGKTMKLPGLLASKCGLRVCQVELDASIAKRALKYQRKLYSIPGGSRAWSRQKKAYLCTMSYHEFRGVVLSGNRERLFEDFDVFYFDEAHKPMAVVWAAKQYFAAYSKPHNSLLIASATVSTEQTNNATARGVGKFDAQEVDMSLEEAIDSGLLAGKHLRDRLLLIVPSDEDVALARSYYMELGVHVRVLDSASTDADEAVVQNEFLVPTSVTPRVLVVTEEYGTSYSFPVSYAVSTCSRRVYELAPDHSLVERVVPLMDKCVTQHKGRVSRGLATGAGGWLLGASRAPDREILASEALEAYLSLVAGGIVPRPGAFDAVTKVLPKGIDAGVARMILRVNLPPALTVRYLGSDGRFAARYCDAVSLFAQTGEPFKRSKDDLPLGHSDWAEESVGRYYMGDEGDSCVNLTIPFSSPPSLKICMHAISAVAAGLLSLEYWDWFDEDEESDDETVGVRAKVKRKVVPRMPEAPSMTFVPSSETVVDPWKYDADPEKAAKQAKRRGMSWAANGDGKAAVTALLRALERGTLGSPVAQPEVGVPEFDGKVAYALPLEDGEALVPVKSAGGGKIMLVTQVVHEKFLSGTALSAQEMVEVLRHVTEIRALERLAKSTLFDNWSSAWLCWFDSYAVPDVMEALKRAAMHSHAIKLLGFLYDRFRSEVVSVAVSSNYYKDKLTGFFRNKPSVGKFVTAVRRGRLPIAQSDAFVARVLQVKDAYDTAVMALEEVGLFAPGLVTGAQRRLPLRDKRRNMSVIDEDVVPKMKGLSVDVDPSVSWRG